MVAQVSARGQITIDREARRLLAIQAGMIAVQVVVDGHLEVYFIPARHERSLFAALPPRSPGHRDTWENIEERAAQSIAAEA
jgi:hypothetical protein